MGFIGGKVRRRRVANTRPPQSGGTETGCGAGLDAFVSGGRSEEATLTWRPK